jgi:hypothetical protein
LSGRLIAAAAPLLAHSLDTFELPDNMTSPVKAQRRTIPGTEGLILDLLHRDGLIARDAGISRSVAYGNRLGEIQRQPAIIEFSANENPQRGIV